LPLVLVASTRAWSLNSVVRTVRWGMAEVVPAGWSKENNVPFCTGGDCAIHID
jgi:hypothetical protein